MQKRVYVVNFDGEDQLVRAINPAQARSFVVKGAVEVHVASSEELYQFGLAAMPIEDAGSAGKTAINDDGREQKQENN